VLDESEPAAPEDGRTPAVRAGYARAAEALELERTFSGLADQAYGLTLTETELNLLQAALRNSS
jgi:hypothetical protein